MPDFSDIGKLLDMRLNPEEALEFVFWSPFKLTLEVEQNNDSSDSFDFA